jgi:hypothetical protein
MVMMNLGVVALPIIELGMFVVDPMRSLLQKCGVCRGDVSMALVGEPALAPANAEVEISEVRRLPTWLILEALPLPPYSQQRKNAHVTRLVGNANMLRCPLRLCSRACSPFCVV